MDEKKRQEARQLLAQISRELTEAAEAARKASTVETEEAWKQVQQLYTRFDEAAQLMRDLRRTVDAGVAGT